MLALGHERDTVDSPCPQEAYTLVQVNRKHKKVNVEYVNSITFGVKQRRQGGWEKKDEITILYLVVRRGHPESRGS